MASVRTPARAVFAPKIERTREAAEETDAEVGALVTEHRCSLLEQFGRTLVDHHGGPTRSLVPDSSLSEELRVPQLTR